jgi:acetylornithine deacetylase
MTDELQKILEHLDDTQLVTLLTDAVDEYSPSYAEEAAMQVFAARLNECGVRYIRQPLPDSEATASDTRANLIIELGPQPAEMMWVGHVDTVPLIDEEEQRMHREGDILHGLGTADMKSGCAAIVEAVIAVVRSGVELKRGLVVALVVGEEEYGDGSEALLEWRTAPLTVIGEPTGLVPCLDHYGYYECLLTVRGARAHAAPSTPCWSGCDTSWNRMRKISAAFPSVRVRSVAAPACSWWRRNARRPSTFMHRPKSGSRSSTG